MMNPDGPEITDLLIDVDLETMERRPISKATVLRVLHRHGMSWGARVARSLPERDGYLDEEQIDALFVRVHAEMQRLWEEFLQGERLRRLLVPLIAALREQGHKEPVRVVDVGCGLGYLVRWLTAQGNLGPGVQLVGCDYNRALIEAASRYAKDEGLACDFRVANAFTLDEPATIFISTGVLHHFRDDDLVSFFAQQRNAAAFLHLDIKPSYLAPIGSLIFHVARMREPISRHDGTHSAVRAHPGPRLLAAARRGATGRAVTLFDGEVGAIPVLRTMLGVVGLSPALQAPFVRRLGPLAGRLGAWS
jgi:SAM-dependent methyltransferase